MDGQLREIGIGDIIVGKHIGRMMSMLGGRLGAYRAGLAEGDLAPALVRNLYRGTAPAPAALAHTRDRLRSEEHTSELQSLMRNSYAVFCLKKQKQKNDIHLH